MAIDNIRQFYDEMSKAEKRVADFMMEHPEETLDLSIAELAKKSETSDATVIRMCRHIGYSGFAQMKLGLAGSLAAELKRPVSGYLIGIDVGGTNTKLMIMNEQQEVIAKRQIATRGEEGYETAGDAMIQAIDFMFTEAGIEEPNVLAVAMGLPGTVDKEKNQTVWLSKLHWDGFNPAEKIGAHYHAPSFIDNDANINALGEYAFGSNGKNDNMVLITLGTGVGCGVIINGKIYGGAYNMAAELGHMIVDAYDGDICLCGRRGHLEAYCSGSALKRDAVFLAGTCPDTVLHEYMKEAGGVFENQMVTRGAMAGDQVCLRLLDRYIHYLAVGVTNVMMMYNPSIIVIGGGLSNAGELLLKPLNEKTKEMVAQERSWCPVVQATLGSEAGMYGACTLAGQSIGL